ncbi:terminase TerL endonuclease subunit [Veillonella parvula]|uniref:terminase large subunit n=1 Tax=Veillonella parvula TaxID=29466 RepID=UPI0029038915|nr:terminase TerL endonuclease subunit [Veillonella parvula]MDU3190529.1 terminase TerL endonuclease subunit [Veillonella parvula]MDU6073006.1 terminase TerL endonuclease subunit [Veillonella parvula]
MTIKEELIQYAKDCINDTKHCCQKHRWACERFLRDISREGTDEFPYIFDDTKAERFYKWASLHKHTKGVLVNTPIIFTPIQRFIFGNIYGWIHKDTGYRRFTKAYWQVGRKNAKSQSLGLVGDYELMALGEDNSEVYIGATKTLQAKIIYNEVLAMLKKSSALFKGKWKEAYSTIVHIKSNSIMRALSKDDGKTGDGLNPQCGLIDEYHAHPTDEILEVIKTGMIARRQPLLFIITTAGNNLGGPCYRIEYPLVSQILNPDIEFDIPDYFCMVNELDRDEEGNLIDDINDEECWIKANPIAATYEVGLKNIRSNYMSAIKSPEKMVSFMTKNMNIWVKQSAQSYIDMAKWKARGRLNEDFENDLGISLYGYDAYVGIDVSKTIDLTAAGIVIPVDINNSKKFITLAHGFIPEETVQTKERTDKIPYRLWSERGWLTITPGEIVDYRFMTKWIEETLNKYGLNIKDVCYDPYNATHYTQELESNKGWGIVEIRQGIITLSEPTKSFRAETYQGNILHPTNDLLDWAISNAVTKVDAQENIMLDKAKSTERIDPIAAIINAYTRAKVAADDDLSEYIMSDEFSL